MTQRRRMAVLIALLYSVMAVGSIWAYGRYAKAQDRASSTATNATISERIAKDISRLQSRRATVRSKELKASELIRGPAI